MTTARYVQSVEFVQYNGANGAEVASFMGQQIVSDNGTVLEMVTPGSPTSPPEWIFHVGDWFSHRAGFWSAANFPPEWSAQAGMLNSGISFPPDVVGTMDAVSVSVPILLLNASVDRTITWARPFADTSYKLSYLNDANTLGRVTPAIKVVSGVPQKFTTGVTLTLTAGLAVAVAGVLHVIGTT